MAIGDILIKEFEIEEDFYNWRKDNISNISILNVNFIPKSRSNNVIITPEVNSYIAVEGQTDFFLNIEYTTGENQLKVYLNGLYLTVNENYIETGNSTIRISEPLEEGDIVSIVKDSGYFEDSNNDEILSNYTIVVSYEEVSTFSLASVKDIKISYSKYGIYLSWEDIYGKSLDERLGTFWRSIEGFESNARNMVFMDWKGVRVVRKEDSAPIRINDGEVVVESTIPNSYLSTPFIDSVKNLTPGKKYYYGIFPYDGWDVYNINENYVVSIEFIIKTWNDVADSFYLTTSHNENGDLTIKWKDPDITSWKGTKLVMNENVEPTNVDDGQLIIDNNLKNRFANKGCIIRDLDPNVQYYFKAFAYDIEEDAVKIETPVILGTSINTLDKIEINFNEDGWEEYFEDLGDADIVYKNDTNKHYLHMKSAETKYDFSGRAKLSVSSVRLKPIHFNRYGTITILLKVYSDRRNKFEIISSNSVKNNLTISGYYLDFDYKILNVESGDADLLLRLSHYDEKAEVLIEKITYTR